MANQKNIRLTTPRGRLRYPHIVTPDTKFNPDGDFKADLILPKDDPETQKLLKRLEQIRDEAYQSELKAQGKKKLKINDHYPVEDEEDDEGEPTGNVIIKTKQKAVIKGKDGSPIRKRIGIFDAQLQPFTPESVWSGTEAKLRIEVAPYYAGATGFGISLRLIQVQILELVQGGSEDSPQGFEAEDGFTASDSEDSEGPDEDEDDTNGEF